MRREQMPRLPFIPDHTHPCVLDGREGVCHNGQARDPRGKPTLHIPVMEGHLDPFVAVFVVHIVDDVQGIHVHSRQPAHHILVPLHDLLIVQIFRGNWPVFGADLFFGDLIHTAVDGVEQTFCKIGSGTEKLHLPAHPHGGHTAGDGIVIPVGEQHNIIVFVLDGGGLNAHPGTVALEGQGKPGRPEHRQIRFRGRAQIFQGVQIPEGHFRNHVPSVHGHSADGLGDPLGISGEQGIILRCPGIFYHPQLHDEVIHKLLDLGFGVNAQSQIPVCVDIQKGRGSAQAHGGAVLFLDGGQIPEIEPLDGFLRVPGRLGNVKAVALCHDFQFPQRTDLFGQLFPAADPVGIHDTVQRQLLGFLVLNQPVHAVQRHPPVVSDDPPSAVGIGEPCDDMAGTAGTHLGGIGIKYTGVVGFPVEGEEFFHRVLRFVAVGIQGFFRGADASVGMEGPLEGPVRLEAHDGLLLFIQITGAVGGDGGDGSGVHVQNTSCGGLPAGQLRDHVPEGSGIIRWGFQEGLVPVVGCVISDDEVTDVDLLCPWAGGKAIPGRGKMSAVHTTAPLGEK